MTATAVFEEKAERDRTDTIYGVSNEKISIWNELLKGVSAKRAAAICSGGEVAFFSILPLVEDELVLVDHSLKSMYFALGKFHAIQKVGVTKARELFLNMRDYGGDPTARKQLADLLKEGNASFPTASCFSTENSLSYYWYGAQEAYGEITEEMLGEFCKNAHKITFVHGDLTDMHDRGPFDFAYLSNALEYTGNGTPFDANKAVKVGGHIALTHGLSGKDGEIAKKHEIIGGVIPESRYGSPYNGYGGLTWCYKVFKVKEAVNAK